MMTINEFCDKHRACCDGREWAASNCASMQEAWETSKHEWLMWIATRAGVVTDNQLRKFAVWSARQVQHLMSDQRSIAALDVAERFSDGTATDAELAAARAAAGAAARAAAGAAAGAAAWDAARDAAWDAAGAAAGDAALAAAGAAAGAAAWDAARAAAWDAARAAAGAAARAAALAAALAAQDEWLRTNVVPNFD